MSENQGPVVEYRDMYLRALADYANLKKRMEKELLSARESGKAELLTSLLPVLDTFNAAVKSCADSGMELAVIKMGDLLEKEGLKEINPIGEVFTHERHQCISLRSGGERGIICEVAAVGYEYRGVMLRYPQVIVYE